MPNCLKYGEERHQECSQTADQGYNECTASRDEGYRDCCDWWPCSWACKAWTWISNIVCVVWTWISNVVCVAWTWITTTFCVIWDIITTVVNAIITLVESIIGWVLDVIAFVIDVIFLIPYVGRFLRELWNGILFIIYTLAGIPDFIVGILGIRPEKKLRVCIIYFTINEVPLGNVNDVIDAAQKAIDVYKDQVNVRIIPVKPFLFSSGFANSDRADNSWIHFAEAPSSPNVLELNCGTDGWGEDFTDIGTYFEQLASRQCFFGNFRSLIGYGAPVILFIVRDVKGKSGCSNGPLSDYATVKASTPLSLKHEAGHACNLWHCCSSTNMMNGETYPSASNPMNNLEWWQINVLRASKHVTYF